MNISLERKPSRRIMKEIESLLKFPTPGISVMVDINNPWFIIAKIKGPDDSPYENGIFDVELYLTDEYPMRSPKIRFQTRIYHPNIDKIGRVSLDILYDRWSPALVIRSLLLSIQLLLSSPNPDDPLDCEIGSHWKRNLSEAISTAKEWTFLYAGI